LGAAGVRFSPPGFAAVCEFGERVINFPRQALSAWHPMELAAVR